MQSSLTFGQLSDKYLAWCKNHKSERTHEWYANYLKMFVKWPNIAEIPIADLKPYHVVEWIDSKPKWGGNYRRGAIVAIQRVYNWGEEMGYSEINPIKKIKKPTATRREIFMQAEDYQTILSHIGEKSPFRDLVLFVWASGCRPQEVRHIEPRHVELENERIVFPAIESKGKRVKRIIYLQGISLEIVQRLMAKNLDGKLFRNSRNGAWTKYAICNNFYRISKITGKRMFCYAARHGFGTRKLIQGHDHLTVAALMGHSDGSMLAKIYSHIDQDTVHLKKALEG